MENEIAPGLFITLQFLVPHYIRNVPPRDGPTLREYSTHYLKQNMSINSS